MLGLGNLIYKETQKNLIIYQKPNIEHYENTKTKRNENSKKTQPKSYPNQLKLKPQKQVTESESIYNQRCKLN